MNVFAQQVDKAKIDSLEKILVGVWEIDKVVDKKGNKVKTITKSMIGSPLGDKIEITATGPKMTLDSDFSYALEFTPQNIDRGKWFLESEDRLVFQLKIQKGTSSYNTLQSATQMLGKTINYDSQGNIVENTSHLISGLDKDKLLIEYEKEYFQVYRKKK